jgi:hypothetical protein
VADVPHLARDPVIAYLPDDFQKPYPFHPSVFVNVGTVLDKIVAMLHCHQSQFYEWLPYNEGELDRVPTADAARHEWLAEKTRRRLRTRADRYRQLLVSAFGREQGAKIEFIEAFEACEYGSPLDEEARRRLFPFATQEVPL